MHKYKTKILFISHSSDLYGAEQSLLSLLRHLDRNRFESTVVLPEDGPLREAMHRLKIKTVLCKCPWWVRCNRNILKWLFNFVREPLVQFRLKKIIKEEQIDIVYSNTSVVFSGAFAARLSGKPHIWHIRELVPGNPDLHFFLPARFLFGLIYALSTRIVTVSKAVAAQFDALPKNGRIETVYNGLDVVEFEARPRALTTAQTKPARWVIAVVGTLQKRKAQSDAIRALQIVLKSYPETKLLLVGKQEPNYTGYLKKLSKTLGIERHVLLMGHQEDVPGILAQCDVVIIPSRNEPFGIVMLEAMACGVPVVAVSGGGVTEVIEDGAAGNLVAPDSPAEIAEKVMALFRDKNLSRRIRNNGKKLVQTKFNAAEAGKSIERILVSV